MKAVFSFWSKPYLRSLHKGFAGFPSEHYFKVAFELAILTARDHFDRIELVTDTEGYAILQKHGFEFDAVSLALDEIADIPSNLWCFGKLKAYSIQKEPFIHLDYDLFLLKPLPKSFYEAAVVTQSVEPFNLPHYANYYLPNMETLLKTHKNLPVEFKVFEKRPLTTQWAHNTGLVGGQNWRAIAAYATMAMKICRDNLPTIQAELTEFRQSEMNVVYEQATISRYCLHHKIKIETLLKLPIYDNTEIENVGLVHLIASSKSEVAMCQNMEITLNKRKAALPHVLPQRVLKGQF